jgi:hypothetical protein
MSKKPCVSLEDHLKALRKADRQFYDERDRRWVEVEVERQRALSIREDYDAGRDSARDRVLDQWQADRGTLMTRIDFESQHSALTQHTDTVFESLRNEMFTALSPINKYITEQQTRSISRLDLRTITISMIGILLVAAAVISPHIH